MGWFISMYLLSVLGFSIHLASLKDMDRTFNKIVELLLLYQLAFSVGMTSLLAFIGITWMPEYVAEYTGWKSCQFQQELANVNLAFGVLGITSIWLRDKFWTATVWGFSIWILGDGIHHLYDMIAHQNYAPGNIGINLATDLIVPLTLITLWYLYDSKSG